MHDAESVNFKCQEFHRILVTPNLVKNVTNCQECSSQCTRNGTLEEDVELHVTINCWFLYILSGLFATHVFV